MKNIVIFTDGTCQESDKGYPTNVYKLYQAVKRRSHKQVAFYDPGVGTGFFKITGAAFGIGISRNIQQCYEFLVDYYEEGDRVYLFGFSRGAYTARSLAGMVSKVGILKKEHRDQSNRAFKLYKKKDNELDVTKFSRQNCWQNGGTGRKPAIYFIGVWDTVSALGFPLAAVKNLNWFSARWHGFHDAVLHKDVRYGYQALSIDDKRKVFKPELWREDLVPGQLVEQVWFVGMHSNVGGGYRRTGLSDITLEWMIKKAKDAGLVLWDDFADKVLTKPDPQDKLYDSREGLGKVYFPKQREIPNGSKIHKSVFDRIANPANFYQPENLPENCTIYDEAKESENEALVGVQNHLNIITENHPKKVFSREKYNDPELVLKKGKEYQVFAYGIWYDKSIACSAEGYTSEQFKGFIKIFSSLEKMRRIPDADWFSLIGVVEKSLDNIINLGGLFKESDSSKVTFIAPESGRLYLFANDLNFMYHNNREYLIVSIEELNT